LDRIFLEGMEFYGFHGVLPEEGVLGQRFIVDLEIYLDLSTAARTDRKEDTVDYSAVYDLVRWVVCGRPHQLIESVAGALAGAVLEKFILAREVVVRVKKPQAPLPGHFAWVGVEVRRRRDTGAVMQ